MRFIVGKDIFTKFPDFCVGVVVGEGIYRKEPVEKIQQLLQTSVQETHRLLQEGSLKERPEIAVWREAFRSLDINPNKYPSSIEALLKRVSKKPEFPSINNVVDLVNALSIKHMVPMGAHDLDQLAGNIEIRFSREGDLFTPFGSDTTEEVPPGEPVYSDDLEVRTRIWIWRQGEKAKTTPDSTRIFFPLDGFQGVTRDRVITARDELKDKLEQLLQARCRSYLVEADNPEVDLES